jgi:hypothetical protein
MALNESKDKNDMQDIKYVEEAEESEDWHCAFAMHLDHVSLELHGRSSYISSSVCIRINSWHSSQRTNIGNAKVAGMTEDLNMNSDQYSIALVVFFITVSPFKQQSHLT